MSPSGTISEAMVEALEADIEMLRLAVNAGDPHAELKLRVDDVRGGLANLTAALWHVGVWGDGSTPNGMANIFCDPHEATIAAGIPKDVAEAIVEAHNEALSALSSSPVGEMDGWQPIETAPKDGTFIITRVGRWTCPTVVHWATYEGVAKWGADPEHFMEEDHFLQYWLEVQYDPAEWLPLEALDGTTSPQGVR